MSAYFKNEALALQQRMKRAFFVQSPLKCATQLLNHSSMMWTWYTVVTQAYKFFKANRRHYGQQSEPSQEVDSDNKQ